MGEYLIRDSSAWKVDVACTQLCHARPELSHPHPHCTVSLTALLKFHMSYETHVNRTYKQPIVPKRI